MAYESLQAILEEAGLQHVELAETPYGVTDGTNTVFVTHHKPLSDAQYDDIVTASDVTVYVNGLPVLVSGVNAMSGAITLAAAPAANADVLVDYRYSPMLLSAVEKVLEEAQDFIDDEMQGTDDVPYDTVPPKIRLICRTFAAGLLLSRDYGFNADIENTSKDGYYKIKRAEGWLKKYKANGGNSSYSSSSGVEDFAVVSDGDLFASSRPEDEALESVSDSAFDTNTE